MADINVNLFSDGDFTKQVEESKKIMEYAKAASKAFKEMGFSGDKMAALVKAQGQIARDAEKIRQEEEKTAKLKELTNDVLIKQLASQQRLKAEQEKVRQEEEKTKRLKEETNNILVKQIGLEQKVAQEEKKVAQEEQKIIILKHKSAEASAKGAVAALRLSQATQKKAENESKANMKLREQQGILGSLIAQEKSLGNAVKAARTPEEFAKASAELGKVSDELSKVNAKVASFSNRIKGAGHDTRGWGDAFGSFQMKFNTIGNLMSNLITSLISGVKQFAINSVKAFMEEEESNKRLLLSLNNNAKAYSRLTEKATELQKISIYSDESIKASMGWLAAMGRTEKQIRKIIVAGMAWARFQQTDLQSGIEIASKAFDGNMKAINKVDVGFKILTDTQLANGEAVDMIIDKYGKLIPVLSFEDKLAQATNAWGDFKESLGEMAAEIGEVVLPMLTRLLKAANAGYFGNKKSDAQWDLEDALVRAETHRKMSEPEPGPNKETTAVLDTVEAIEKYIQKLQTLNKTLVINSEEYKENVKEIEKYQEMLTGNKAKKAREEWLKQQAEIQTAKEKEFALWKESLKVASWMEREIKDETDRKKQLTEVQYGFCRSLGFTHKETMQIIKDAEATGHTITSLADVLDTSADVAFNAFKKIEIGSTKMSEKVDENFEKTLPLAEKWAASADVHEFIQRVLGVNDEQMASIEENLQTVQDMFEKFIDAKTEMYKQDVENSTARIAELQNNLQAELQLNQQGYASNMQLTLNNIAAEEEIRKKTIEQQRKYQKAQSAIDSAMTISSTITAIANIFKTWSKVPYVGYAFAAVQVAAMMLTISAARTKADTIAKYRKGKIGIELPPGVEDGEDTIHALLTKNESIITPEGTKAYSRELQLINDNQSPDKIIASLLNKGANLHMNTEIWNKIYDKMPEKDKKEILIINGKRVERWGNTTRTYN